jgi:hydroxymethylglutaryl-CoA synthase
VNACYGGTNALFSTINWLQSNAWDGRLGLVLCADVAVYPKGNARPTGGCGAVAMLIGPNAPLVFEDVRSTFIDNIYDFYKPDPSSEYPTVDGHLSINIYLNALANCYESFKAKYRQRYPGVRPFNYHEFDYFCFHTPFSKMVQKAFYHLVLQDILTSPLECARSRYPQALLEELA